LLAYFFGAVMSGRQATIRMAPRSASGFSDSVTSWRSALLHNVTISPAARSTPGLKIHIGQSSEIG
jgi:hypothetical protein